MNGRFVKPLRSLVLALLLPMAAACGHGSDAGAPPLAGARIGGPFTLTDQDGRTVRDTDFAGKARLVYFGYTYCPDACPTMLQHIGQGLHRFEAAAPDRAARVQPIFITVDPARDTPAVLKAYVAAFHPRLVGLTGTPAQIAQVAKEYAVSYGRVKAKGASDYLVQHSTVALLFGPDGQPITMITPDQDAAAIEQVLAKWVK